MAPAVGVGALFSGLADEESLVVDELILVAQLCDSRIGAGDLYLHDLKYFACVERAAKRN